MEFLTGDKLRKAIEKLAKGKKLRLAVAFWGTGSENLLGDALGGDIRIICNLKSGGTNPYVLENFPRDKVKQHDHLHAKVYIGEDKVVVTSANASANGLGLEGSEQNFWEEAGVLVDRRSINGVDD